MSEENHQDIVWKIIKLEVVQPNAMLQIDEKLPLHIKEIKSISIHSIPISSIDESLQQIGELSLSLNNRKEHILHTTADFTNNTLENNNQTLIINAKLEKNAVVNGYYRDYGLLKSDASEFVPYAIKLLLECKIN